MSYKLVLADGERERIRGRFTPNQARMEVIGAFVNGQIDARFETQGESGGEPWKSPKFVEDLGRGDGRKLLEGIGGQLRAGFDRSSTANETEIANPHVAAVMAQQGTEGKGGELPDIRPRNAAALFIPISDRAQLTRPITPFGWKQKRAYDASLVKGKLKDGRLEPPDADFIYLSRVGIPARPVLPASDVEREKLTDLVVEVLKDGPES